MKRFFNLFTYFIAAFIISACTNSPRIYRVSGQVNVRSEITSAIENSGLSTNIGIKIVSLEDNEPFYELNARSLFNPASNNKIYTCVAALALLGTGYTFSTAVYNENGNIYLVGGGDPALSLNSIDSMALVVAGKINQVDTLFLDATLLDSVRFGKGWMWDEGSWKYAAQISALSLNSNGIDFYITPGDIGRPAQVIPNPETDYIQIINRSITVNDTAGFVDIEIDRDWANRTNKFTITGTMMDTTSVDTISRNIEDPCSFTGMIFKEMLKNHGIQVNVIAKRGYPDNGELMTEHISESLIYSLKNLMKESDNLTAELLVKTIGKQISGTTGTWQNGLTAMKLFFQNQVGLDSTSFYLADGSGVSRYNYSSPEHFTQLLSWAYANDKIRNNLISTLPVGGWDGTLKDRMNAPYGNQIIAKTGTLSGVSCLSGYVITQSGETLVFSIMMNGYVGKADPFRKLQDTITGLLANL